MKLTIFSRLLTGHLVIFALVIGMSAYAIVQISRINEMTQSVLMVNNRISDNAERLSDVVFSQVRYERKYLISKDEVFYNQFLQLKADFDRSLGEMMSIADSLPTKGMLTVIKESYQNYHFLFQEELKFLRAGRSYSREGFNREKEKAIEYLRKAISLDPKYKEKARSDRDLDPLRGLKEFEELAG